MPCVAWHSAISPDRLDTMPESLESLRGSFNRSLRVESKADRTLVLYDQSITYFSQWLAKRGQPADVSNLNRDAVSLGALTHRKQEYKKCSTN